MKYLIALMFALFATLAPAQQINQGPAGPNAKDLAVVFTVGWFIAFGSVVTGQVPELCTKLKGTYTPTGIDRCPDGQWRNLISG
jgi:hypothetical protein